jgi:hypothetical protein
MDKNNILRQFELIEKIFKYKNTLEKYKQYFYSLRAYQLESIALYMLCYAKYNKNPKFNDINDYEIKRVAKFLNDNIDLIHMNNDYFKIIVDNNIKENNGSITIKDSKINKDIYLTFNKNNNKHNIDHSEDFAFLYDDK